MRTSERRLGLVVVLIAGCFNPTGGGGATTTTTASSEGATTTTHPTTSDPTSDTTGTTRSTTDLSTSATTTTTDATTTAVVTTEPADTDTTTDATSTGTTDTSTTTTDTTGTADTTGTTEKTCGDMELQNDEECDDGNLSPGDGCNTQCKREVLLMFVSSAQQTGAFGGLTSADNTCEALAALALQPPLKGRRPEKFVAYLAAPGADVALRVHNGDLGYARPKDLALIAKDYPSLITGSFLVPVLHDETGTQIGGNADCGNIPVRVWTGVNPDGTTSTDHCDSWTDTLLVGSLGYAVSSGTQAISACGANCLGSARFYCVENP